MPQLGSRILIAFVALTALTTEVFAKEKIDVVVDTQLSEPSMRALAELQRALMARGFDTQHHRSLAEEGWKIVTGKAGASKIVDRLLAEHRIQLPKQAESLCIQQIKAEKNPTLLIAGSDERGLSYALLDVARAIELAPKTDTPLAGILEAVESPHLRVRSITIQLFNADLEADWYYDENFWVEYFKLLAQCRYNNFTLTFSHQTNYLNPLYAYLVDVPGFPQVSVKGLAPQDRARNLAMLKRIAEMAHERGLDFTLGIWTQLPVEKYPGEIRVEHLPTGLAAAKYCAAGLQKILETCSAIDAVQFRMNAEAGVSEDQQTDFYQPLFQAIRDCGHPVRVDLRYKGLRPETIAVANKMKLDVTVSTKFWCEHMGLPYHPTAADTHYRDSRYSFGAMLEHPRSYRVLYQLWSVGSQRLLLWGDPNYAARFAESCRLGDGDGFEVNAPLTNKGFGDLPGEWRIFADKSLEHFEWEYERYWFFYLAFGRMGYNPKADPETWRRELRSRFGEAAEDIESAYRSASAIIPLVTASHQPSGGEWAYWPEMDTGDRLTEYMHTPPSDTAQFYAIRSWKQTPRWRCETWDENIPGFVDDAIKVGSGLRAKTTPIEVSQRLRDLSTQTMAHMTGARTKVRDTTQAEFRATFLDFRVLAGLARYHADKTQAAVDLAIFELTKNAHHLPRALQSMSDAAAAWEQIARLTDGTYHSNLVFGFSPQHGRKNGHHHSGHWKNRLPEIREDVAYLERLVEQFAKGKTAIDDDLIGRTPQLTRPALKLAHEPAPTLDPARDAQFALTVSDADVEVVVLYYRVLNQTMDWKRLVLKRGEGDRFIGTVSSKEILSRWDFQYYFEVFTRGGQGGQLWPAWRDGTPYFVSRVGKIEIQRD